MARRVPRRAGLNSFLGFAEEFWYASSLLWTATEQQPTLDMTKEVHEFPFSLTIPPIVPTSARIRKQCR